MIIAVNDTNILIDLINVGLIDDFLKLNFEFITTNLIVDEFKIDAQASIIDKYIQQNKLQAYNLTFDELTEVQNIKETSSKKLSFEDCSVWYLAKKKQAILLTGDNLLRKNAEKDGITVSGILFILDQLVENNILNKQTAHTKLKALQQINNRLPKNEINKRLNLWEKGER